MLTNLAIPAVIQGQHLETACSHKQPNTGDNSVQLPVIELCWQGHNLNKVEV